MSLKLERVSKVFGKNVAVNRFSLEISNGQIYGLLGANGAGKTTTIRMILGLLSPTEGVITWNNERINYSNSDGVGYLPEERGLYPKLTVHEQLSYLARLKGMEKRIIVQQIDYWLERFYITEYKNRKVDELSKGNQQKIQFIASIIHNPKLLFFDEPFSGLDPLNVELLKDSIVELAAKGSTIIFSSHRLDHVEELCQNISILHKGSSVVQGNLKEIKRSFGKKSIVIHCGGNLDHLKNTPGVLNLKKTAQGYLLQITEDSIAQEILMDISNKGGFISKFELEEPSLNDIFIEKVGANFE